MTLVIQGESGGGNLVLARAIKANREGWIGAVGGVYASVPYISGGYAWPRDRKLVELPCLVENDGYLVNAQAMDLLVDAYDPKERARQRTSVLALFHHRCRPQGPSPARRVRKRAGSPPR